MQGNKKVIELLNQVLTNELTAINQYFVHSKMCADKGYHKLATKLRAESIDEMKHAEAMIDRILYLEGLPNVQRLGKISVGQSVPEMMTLDLALEKEAVTFLNASIEVCAAAKDNGSLELVKSVLVSEEEHIGWIEEQISLIESIGVQNYLASQL